MSFSRSESMADAGSWPWVPREGVPRDNERFAAGSASLSSANIAFRFCGPSFLAFSFEFDLLLLPDVPRPALSVSLLPSPESAFRSLRAVASSSNNAAGAHPSSATTPAKWSEAAPCRSWSPPEDQQHCEDSVLVLLLGQEHLLGWNGRNRPFRRGPS